MSKEELSLGTPTTTARVRLYIVVFTCAIYLALLSASYLSAPPEGGWDWLGFGGGALIAALFLAVGALVFLYAQKRAVATVLFGLCVAMMVTFSLLASQNPALGSLSTAGSTLAVVFFATLVLQFPHDFLSGRGGGGRGRVLLRIYLTLLACWSLVIVGLAAVFWRAASLPGGAEFLADSYFAVGLIGCLATVLVGLFRRKRDSLRERQQRRIFVGGSLLAICPVLFLTILPSWFGLPARFSLDGRISALTLAVLPVALGYPILRYQILALDRYVRRIVGWIAGVVMVGCLGYLAIIATALVGQSGALVLLLAMGLTVPVWLLSNRLSDRAFFPEALHYRRLLAGNRQPAPAKDLDLHQSAQALVQEAMGTFEAPLALVFVLFEDTERNRRCFQLVSAPAGGAPGTPLEAFLHTLLEALPVAHEVVSPTEPPDFAAAIAYQSPVVSLLAHASRPLHLWELAGSLSGPTPQSILPGLDRYFDRSWPGGGGPLLVPIRAQGQLVGILVLAERGNRAPYTGPEFDALDLLVTRFLPTLELARLTERATRQQARLTAELANAHERQQALEQLKDQFITTTSHELRTPLTAVHGYLELLQTYNGQLSVEQVGDLLEKALLGSNELTLLLSNIIDVSMLEADIKQIDLAMSPLLESVLKVLDILDGIIVRDQRQVKVEIPAALLVKADELRLRQVLLNLLVNALKYSPQGSVLDITAAQRDDNVVVGIRDYGRGIPAEEQGRLFERFARMDRDINSPVRGTGLGLYICKKIIEAMGGRIWVESTGVDGDGSLFSFTLQLATTSGVISDAAAPSANTYGKREG